MNRSFRIVFALTIAIAATEGAARAQYGYPRGYGGYGWGGWGGGGETPQGSMARGMGAYAAGAGYYNQQTAVARSINVDTAMRYNQYMYQSNEEANRKYHAKMAEDKSRNLENYDKTQDRLLNRPEQRDIFMGDALNALVTVIEDPRVYSRTLEGAKVKIGGQAIHNIPFRYAPGAITISIEKLTSGDPPPILLTAPFDDIRSRFKVLGQEIRKDLNEGEKPNPQTVDKALVIVNEAEAKVEQVLERNTKDRNDADKFLKALHGLLGMTQTPALDILLAGVEDHPEATLGQLLGFMSAYNLRFGEAKTPTQKGVYVALYPQLAALRAEVAPVLAGASPPKSSGSEVGDFFSAMDYKDLQKKAPPPAPKPGGSSN
jgi:hypothetical protein